MVNQTPAADGSRSPAAEPELTIAPRFVWGLVALLLAGGVGAGLSIADMRRPSVVVNAGAVEPMARGPVARTKTIALNAATATPIVYATGAEHSIAICSVATTGAAVYIVDPGATSTAQGAGPWGDGETLGAQMPPLGMASAIAASGTPSIRCAFYSEPLGAAVGVGGGGGGAPGADCIADGTCLPVDAAGVLVAGENYTEGMTLYDVTDGTDSSYSASLYPGELFAQSVADYAGLSLSTHTGTVNGATVSRARLQAFPAVYAGTGPGGRALAGGVTMTMTGDDAAAVSTINVTTGDGLSIGQGADEWLYLSATGSAYLTPLSSAFAYIGERDYDGLLSSYLYNANTGTSAGVRFILYTAGLAQSSITRFGSGVSGTVAGLPNANAMDVQSDGDIRVRADGGDVAFIAGTTPLAYLGAAGLMAGVAGTPDVGSVSLPWDDLFYDGTITNPTDGFLRLGGAARMAQRRVTSTPITVAGTDGAIICDTGSNSITLNLPGTHEEGHTLTVVKENSANVCTLDPASAELIDGESTLALYADGAAVSLTWNVAYGTWFVTSTREGTGARDFDAIKTSATARTSDATATADPTLTFTVPPGTYRFTVNALMATAGAGVGYRIGLGGTATTTTFAGDCVRWETAFSSSVQNRISTFGTAFAEAAGTNSLRFDCTGVVVVSVAGTVATIWGQNASSADALTMQAGSSMKLERI